MDTVKIVNANSEKMVAVDQASMAESANVLLWTDAETDDQSWSFAHQDNGYYQIRAAHSDKCLSAASAAAAGGQNAEQRSRGSGASNH